MYFWLFAGVMVMIALLIILPPLWRERKEAIDDDLDQRNIAIARDRLAELKANRNAGGISQTQYEEQAAELELALSDDLDLSKSEGTPPTQGRWLVYVLLIAVPVVAFTLYTVLGNYQAIGRVNNSNETAQSDMPSPEAINQMVAKLAEKLKKEPGNLEGWLMLGRSYKVMERYQEAVDAYANAMKLAGEKPDVMLPYAEVVALSQKGNWSGTPEELVMKVLAKEPEQPTALWFAAMVKAQKGDKKTAVGYLKKLETLLPADSSDKQQVHEIIANTEAETGGSTAPSAPVASPAKTASITVDVSLSDALKAAADAQDTVFIYAQALSGPKMPLAIIRKKVADLPVSVQLSDADAMMPALKLSNFPEIRLLARISKSGSAMPQSGDLIGSVESAKSAGGGTQKIIINDKVQ